MSSMYRTRRHRLLAGLCQKIVDLLVRGGQAMQTKEKIGKWNLPSGCEEDDVNIVVSNNNFQTPKTSFASFL